MPLAKERIIHRILGFKLLALATIAITLYSASSAYIGASLIQAGLGLEGEPPAPNGLGLLSVYSGVASTPVTGLLPESILENVSGVEGVVDAWGEVSTPALVNDTLVVIRGVPWSKLREMGAVLANGSVVEDDVGSVIVGSGLAGELGLHVGDKILVDPLFSNSIVLFNITGVFEGPQPYNHEIIVNPLTARGLRGHEGYTTLRILYDPGRLNRSMLSSALGVENGWERILLHQAVLLVSKGVVKVMDPGRLQSYYIERMGVPPEYIFALGLSSDTLLALLTIPLAWLLLGVRRSSLQYLYEEGVPHWRLKLSVIVVSLPYLLTGVLAGLFLARLYPSRILLGYPIVYDPSAVFTLSHTLAFTLLYTLGVAGYRLKG